MVRLCVVCKRWWRWTESHTHGNNTQRSVFIIFNESQIRKQWIEYLPLLLIYSMTQTIFPHIPLLMIFFSLSLSPTIGSFQQINQLEWNYKYTESIDKKKRQLQQNKKRKLENYRADFGERETWLNDKAGVAEIRTKPHSLSSTDEIGTNKIRIRR